LPADRPNHHGQNNEEWKQQGKFSLNMEVWHPHNSIFRRASALARAIPI